eukprot:15455597-Alexandrium_andersonii.AAC.1
MAHPVARNRRKSEPQSFGTERRRRSASRGACSACCRERLRRTCTRGSQQRDYVQRCMLFLSSLQQLKAA